MIVEEANQQTENKNQNKEKSMATEMKIRRMSDVQLQEVAWLWRPYIPFGKITISVQMRTLFFCAYRRHAPKNNLRQAGYPLTG